MTSALRGGGGFLSLEVKAAGPWGGGQEQGQHLAMLLGSPMQPLSENDTGPDVNPVLALTVPQPPFSH